MLDSDETVQPYVMLRSNKFRHCNGFEDAASVGFAFPSLGCRTWTRDRGGHAGDTSMHVYLISPGEVRVAQFILIFFFY